MRYSLQYNLLHLRQYVWSIILNTSQRAVMFVTVAMVGLWVMYLAE